MIKSRIDLDSGLRREDSRRFLTQTNYGRNCDLHNSVMKLRDHPLMSYHGLRNWPPVWVGTGDRVNTRVTGEVGTLTAIKIYDLSYSRIFLVIEYEEHRYTGCLFFEDRNFCRSIYDLLQSCVRMAISEISEIDIGSTL
jgi:hypothetical protein